MSPAPDASGYQLLTGPGPAAIAVVRVFGARAERFVQAHLRPGDWRARADGQMRRAALLDSDGEVLDEVLVTVHASAPQWDLRLHTHGSPAIVARLIQMLTRAGFCPASADAMTAWPGEAGIDQAAYSLMPRMLTLTGVRWLERQRRLLPQALAAARAAPTPEASARILRGLRARRDIAGWFLRPLRVAVVGPPNAGKSTLVNALAGDQVSIVSSRPGTTRDWIEAPGEISGLPVVWLDTAGLRPTADPLEAAGIAATEGVLAGADVSLLLFDATDPASATSLFRAWPERRRSIVAVNKIDQAPRRSEVMRSFGLNWRRRIVAVSALTGENLKALTAAVMAAAGRNLSQLSVATEFR